MDIGPYRVVRTLGAGGMGEVFLAEDSRLQRQVALKALQAEPDPAANRRLLHEARAAARLNHPNIAAVHDVIEGDGRSFIVMEYVDGVPLSTLAAGAPMAIARVLDIGIQLADAIGFAHAQGVVHRDVKPANVMVTGEGHVKLLDLGLARVTHSDAGMAAAVAETTSTGMPLAGTPPYMAPEQLLGGEANTSTDIYSLGVLLFELLTGRRPFDGTDMVSLVMSIASGPIPKVQDVRPDVPAALSNLVAWAMAREPRDRPATAERVRAELAAIRKGLDKGTMAAVPIPQQQRRRHFYVVPAVALAAIVIALLAGLPRGNARPAAAKPIVAVLPAVNLSGDAEVDAIGAGLMSVISDNLETAPGVTVVPQGGASKYRTEDRDLAVAARELGAEYLVDLSLQKDARGVTARTRLVRAGSTEPEWVSTLTGDVLSVHRGVLESLSSGLQRSGVFPSALTDEDRRRLRAVPTQSSEALQAYAQARVLLDSLDSREKVESALALCERALARDASFALAHAAQSEGFAAMFRHTRDAGWLTRAAESARVAMNLEPRSGQVQYALARVYYANGRPADAIRHLEIGQRLSPESDDIYRLTGMVLRAQGKMTDAFVALRKAIDLRPGYWYNHHQLGLTHVAANQYREAIPAFTRVTELRPDYAGGYQALGAAHHYTGDIDRAIGYYQAALSVGVSAEAHSNLGYSYYAAGKFDKALEMYEKAVALNPTGPAPRRNLADVLMRLGRTQDARKAYAEAIARANALLAANPRDVAMIGIVALSEARLGRIDAAIRRASEALALAADDSDALYTAAAVFAVAGRADKSLELLGRALELGYPRQLARDDDYFAPVRNDERFKRLLAGPQP